MAQHVAQQLAQKRLHNSSLQPDALATAELLLGCSSPGNPPPCEWGLRLQPQRKAQGQLTMGPLTQRDEALSGKTRSQPQHPSLRPALLEPQGHTEPTFTKKQEQGQGAAKQPDFWEDGRWVARATGPFITQLLTCRLCE